MKNSCKTLLAAGSIYGQCARRVEAHIKAEGQLNAASSERIIGLGIARDWVRLAGLLSAINYTKSRMDDSKRARSFNEIVRYSFSWSGINAIFSRNELLHLLGTPKSDSELDRFHVLFQAAGHSTTYLSTREKTLHTFLSRQTITRLPLTPPGTAVSTLRAINIKYIPPSARKKGIGKRIDDAASSGNLSALDIPTLLYAFRNWSVHGNALDGSFGGREKFNLFLNTLNETLADVHLNMALALLQCV
jgi:hypothetical protein